MGKKTVGGPNIGGPSRDVLGRHVLEAHATLRGEHQIAGYVARLELGECARILAAAPDALPRLAGLRDACRVVPGESRSFEDVIRTWTEYVLSGTEGG